MESIRNQMVNLLVKCTCIIIVDLKLQIGLAHARAW